MQSINRMNQWTNAHDPAYMLDIVRVCLGGFMFVKGLQFGGDAGYVATLINLNSDFFAPVLLSHFVILTHLGGGILLMAGLFTRLVTIAYLPILGGAVAANFLGEMHPATLVQASVCLVLCCVFLVLGSGKGSFDKSLHMHM